MASSPASALLFFGLGVLASPAAAQTPVDGRIVRVVYHIVYDGARPEQRHLGLPPGAHEGRTLLRAARQPRAADARHHREGWRHLLRWHSGVGRAFPRAALAVLRRPREGQADHGRQLPEGLHREQRQRHHARSSRPATGWRASRTRAASRSATSCTWTGRTCRAEATLSGSQSRAGNITLRALRGTVRAQIGSISGLDRRGPNASAGQPRADVQERLR